MTTTTTTASAAPFADQNNNKEEKQSALDAAAGPAAGVLPPRIPERDAAAARRLYAPPQGDALPLLAAALALGCWAASMSHALFSVRLPSPALGKAPAGSASTTLSPWWDALLTFAAVEFASTALFITAHDAMHGAVCRRRRWLNDAIGRLCLSLYAWFDYGLLYEKHWEVG